MALTPFVAGFFNVNANCAAWDGTNDVDMLEWVRGLDPKNSVITDDADRWQITATSPDLVLHRPATHPGFFAMTVIVPLNFWVTCTINGGNLYVGFMNPASGWVASDLSGRPSDINDLLPPAPPPGT